MPYNVILPYYCVYRKKKKNHIVVATNYSEYCMSTRILCMAVATGAIVNMYRLISYGYILCMQQRVRL